MTPQNDKPRTQAGRELLGVEMESRLAIVINQPDLALSEEDFAAAIAAIEAEAAAPLQARIAELEAKLEWVHLNGWPRHEPGVCPTCALLSSTPSLERHDAEVRREEREILRRQAASLPRHDGYIGPNAFVSYALVDALLAWREESANEESKR